MKYLAFLVLTSVPLVALTVFAVIELANPQATATLRKIKKQEKLAQAASQFANSTHEVTKQRAMVKSLIAKALKGDTRAASVLITLILGIEQADQEKAVHIHLSDEDEAILAAYQKQLLGQSKQDTEGEAT